MHFGNLQMYLSGLKDQKYRSIKLPSELCNLKYVTGASNTVFVWGPGGICSHDHINPNNTHESSIFPTPIRN